MSLGDGGRTTPAGGGRRPFSGGYGVPSTPSSPSISSSADPCSSDTTPVSSRRTCASSAGTGSPVGFPRDRARSWADPDSLPRNDSRLARWNRTVDRGSVMVRRDGGRPVAWEGRTGSSRGAVTGMGTTSPRKDLRPGGSSVSRARDGGAVRGRQANDGTVPRTMRGGAHERLPSAAEALPCVPVAITVPRGLPYRAFRHRDPAAAPLGALSAAIPRALSAAAPPGASPAVVPAGSAVNSGARQEDDREDDDEQTRHRFGRPLQGLQR